MAGSEVVVRDTTAALARFMQAGTTAAEVDPERAALDMVARILNAESVDDVLEGREAIHAKDVLGVPLTILGVRFNESDQEGGPGFYALMDCVDSDGNGFAVTCGALSVMAQLHRLNELSAFPVRLVVEQSDKATKAGYRPMHLRKAPESF